MCKGDGNVDVGDNYVRLETKFTEQYHIKLIGTELSTTNCNSVDL